uniref:Fibronectin type-III domain-containing protein n=1 Tax=Mesocestoides corti TaxID=53468 RepID=A0A5K3FXX3_MESCO
ILLIAAPEGVNVTAISNSSLNVTIQPPVDSTNISHYNVTLGELSVLSACVIEVGKEPMGCELRWLSAATNYTV